LNEYKKSLNDLKKAIKLNPYDPDYYFSLGDLYFSLEDFKNSIINFNKAIELKPNYSEYYDHRGNVWFEIKEYVEAISNYDKAIELDDSNYFAINSRGLAKYELLDYNGAIADFDKAIQLTNKSTSHKGSEGEKTFSEYAETFQDFKGFDIGNLRDGQILTTHGIDESGKYTPYKYTVATLDVSDDAERRPPSIPANVFARLFGIEATGQTVNIMIDASPIAINELISKLTPVDGFRLNVNLVVNREAVNDPATRPSELKGPAGDHVRCDTLYDSGQSNIIYSEKDPFFTKYTITMGKLDIGKDPKRLKALKCKVEISYGERETHISLNPKKDNSIDTCLNFIKGLFSVVYDLFTRKRISVAYTQKASGDAGEAMSALDDTREYTSLNTR
ncbi:MAG: tetratricopeptide repeat protein, partial [Alphaproteobacteria bacterium]|nr:tetratricopeptide repeat protein [Alphaproteobacteria bacterium]